MFSTPSDGDKPHTDGIVVARILNKQETSGTVIQKNEQNTTKYFGFICGSAWLPVRPVKEAQGLTYCY